MPTKKEETQDFGVRFGGGWLGGGSFGVFWVVLFSFVWLGFFKKYKKV